MKHVIFGGDGFTGRWLTSRLISSGANVLVCDLSRNHIPTSEKIAFQLVDVRDPASVTSVPLDRDDVVYHLAARQYHLKVPRFGRERSFEDVNVVGTRNILTHAHAEKCRGVVFFSTDMVYGLPSSVPVGTEHPKHPLGPYGESKRKAEEICSAFWSQGLRVTILRPRLILGPGRLGVFKSLFRLIRSGFPVPLIGDGSNRYQMVSVFDCASAAVDAVAKGIPNGAYNLGSKNPPTSRELLEDLIHRVGSRSILVNTPAPLVKGVLSALDAVGLTVLYPEQFLIADRNYLVDSSETERQLAWTPQYSDRDMIFEAFRDYRRLGASTSA